MSLSPITPRNRDQAVLERLASYIAEARIQPGERLPAERDLAERLGVGRSTVREALKRWEALGLIEMQQGRGTFLKAAVDGDALQLPLLLQVKRASLLQTLEVRRGLECEAGSIAALRQDRAAIARIAEKLEIMETVHRRDGNAPDEDWAFHLSIYEATGNPLFAQIVSILYDAFYSFFTNPLKQPEFAGRSFPFHRRLYEAIEAGDEAGARSYTRAILDIVEDDVRRAGRPEQSR